MNKTDTRLIAFFLPQFHPTPENDAWWGKGFTEWTNVTKSNPLFNGHYQPHLPTDMGFYDLRLAETRHEQVKLAQEYGIDGFCYHYYWFSGRRVLNAPLDAMLADAQQDMPFCLCWANENWTRRWDGADHELLIAQAYLPEDDLNFIKDLMPFFNDSRYIRLNNKPILIVYRPQHLPDAQKTLNIWRNYCREVGIGEIHLICALTHGNENYAQYGFDSGVEFPPHNINIPIENKKISFYQPFQGALRLYHKVAQHLIDYQYEASCRKVFKTVFPSWDNSARTGDRAVLFLNGTPGNYEYWLAETIRRTEHNFPDEERLVFINAWNEWAEGCHLEPDRRYGRGFLEATRTAKLGRSTLQDFPDQTLSTDSSVSRQAAHSESFFVDIFCVCKVHFAYFLAYLKHRINKYPWLRACAIAVLSNLRRIYHRFK